MLLALPLQVLLADLLPPPQYKVVYSTSHVTTAVGVVSPVTANLTAGDLFTGGKKKSLGLISQSSNKCIYVTDKKEIKEVIGKCRNLVRDISPATRYFKQPLESKKGVEVRITPVMSNHKMHRVTHPRVVEGQVMSELTNGLEPIAYVACEHGHEDPRHASCHKGVWIRSWLLDHPGNISVRKVTITEEPQDDGGMIIRFTGFEKKTHKIDIHTYDDDASKDQQYKGLEVNINTGVLLDDGVNLPGHNITSSNYTESHNAGLYNAAHNPVTYLVATFLMLSTMLSY